MMPSFFSSRAAEELRAQQDEGFFPDLPVHWPEALRRLSAFVSQREDPDSSRQQRPRPRSLLVCTTRGAGPCRGISRASFAQKKVGAGRGRVELRFQESWGTFT
ncbi:unnamed protein product [Symbiodinium natans]|uniref:Uncharacterized protein n=1 Tax=Symbiodinium natans TaxID=878477 RepID=A0A812QM29_9DINO|nr:unnamed protein product [Symbiodinium natans]